MLCDKKEVLPRGENARRLLEQEYFRVNYDPLHPALSTPDKQCQGLTLALHRLEKTRDDLRVSTMTPPCFLDFFIIALLFRLYARPPDTTRISTWRGA